MTTTERFQVSVEAAEMYESTFVPALFAEWAPLLVDTGRVERGQSVLDVACGTGIVARTAADRLAGTGRVVGLDLNAAMLAVARRVRPDLEWQQGDVAALPFPAGAFDRVLCQMALMFFPDRAAALREMARVAAPGGIVAVCVPAALDQQPAYGPFVDMAVDRAGPAARSLLSTYWACGDRDELAATVSAAGLEVVESRTHLGTASFPSPEALAETEVRGSPLVDRITDDVFAQIRDGAREVLQPFTGSAGAVEAPLRGLLLAARVPEG